MLIELSAVEKLYNQGEPHEVRALHNINLTVQQNELVCLCGPSGSGKSTILSIIGCVFPPTSGRATLGGRKISRLPDHHLCSYRRRMIGFIFQHFSILPDLSVIENVTLPLYPAGIAPKERVRRALPYLERLGIAHRKDFPASRISGGELQRVAICRALINNPPVILADEPTAHLDSMLSKTFMEIMEELKEEGKTIVITSHDARVFTHRAIDRVIHVADGRLVDRRMGT